MKKNLSLIAILLTCLGISCVTVDAIDRRARRTRKTTSKNKIGSYNTHVDAETVSLSPVLEKIE